MEECIEITTGLVVFLLYFLLLVSSMWLFIWFSDNGKKKLYIIVSCLLGFCFIFLLPAIHRIHTELQKFFKNLFY
jgi:hypothetical protein